MNQTTTSPRSRKPLPAVSGTAKLLQAIGTVGKPEDRQGEISINGKAYFCKCLDHSYQLFGFDAKRGQSTVYDLPADLSSCDCADSTFREDRPGGCKHRRALQVLVNAGKLPRLECNPVPRVDDLADADEALANAA